MTGLTFYDPPVSAGNRERTVHSRHRELLECNCDSLSIVINKSAKCRAGVFGRSLEAFLWDMCAESIRVSSAALKTFESFRIMIYLY